MNDPYPPPIQSLYINNHTWKRKRRPPFKLPAWVRVPCGILAGGAIGIILGQLIVWWVLRVDPIEIAPRIAKVFPDIVPVHLVKEKQ